MAQQSRDAASTSDIEQSQDGSGNSPDGEQGEENTSPPPPGDVLGSSGYVPQAEIARARTEQPGVSSPGAEADRLAAERGR